MIGIPLLEQLFDRIRKGISENPLVWILAALLALAEYGSYQVSASLTRVCELLGPHDVSVAVARTPREEIDNICINRQADGEPE
jgi:hypothetical protein